MTPRKDAPDEVVVARDATYHRASGDLRARIRADIAAEDRREAPRRFWRWGGIAAAFAVGALVSWNVALMRIPDGDEERIARDVQAAHVRSLLAEGHLHDVASSDQHTVKPWFQGRIDFSPVVVDLAGAGYPLTGGRLDYVDGRPVAAITYGLRRHVVNVFAWPARGGTDAAPAATSRNGYSLVHWRHGGFEYWAISDAAAPEVLKLASLIASS
jgi:anti-sigma factor RsiW